MAHKTEINIQSFLSMIFIRIAKVLRNVLLIMSANVPYWGILKVEEN